MSCAVGLVDKGRVILAADSLGVCPGDMSQGTYTKNAKVYRLSNGLQTMSVSHVGSWRLGQLVQYGMELPEKPDTDPLEYLVRHFVPALHECLRNAGAVIHSEEGVEHGGQLLVGYRGRLFVVQGDFAVLEPDTEYAAIGSGSAEALATLWLTEGQDMDPEDRVELALQAASNHRASVGEPFVVDVLEESCTS